MLWWREIQALCLDGINLYPERRINDMQFPMRDAMTKDQTAVNLVAQQVLVRGKYYRFDPPVKAGAVPTGGPNVCELEECEFDRGWYIGLV